MSDVFNSLLTFIGSKQILALKLRFTYLLFNLFNYLIYCLYQ